MNVGIKVLLLCLIFSCQTLQALEIQRLYEAEVISSSNSLPDKVTSIHQALKIVLSRILTGDNILKDDTVKKVLDDKEFYVKEFQYSLPINSSTSMHNSRLIRVLFDEDLLINVFRSSRLGVWNEIRPKTLIWLVVEENGQQKLFDADAMPDIEAAIDKASKQKAVPVLYPLQDLHEKQHLSINAVLSAYADQLLEFSNRYDVVSTLAGKMDKTGACWKAEWTFYFDTKIDQWQSQCGSIKEATLNGMQGVYDRLSKFYSVKSELKTISSVYIKVANATDKLALEKVDDYLNSLPMAKTITWVGIDSGYNLYRVFFEGSRQVFNESLTQGRVLAIEDISQQHANEVKYKLLAEYF